MTANADSGLWRHRDFRLYWTGQASDVLGSSLSSVAIPLVAVVSLNATTWQAAILAAVQKTPPLLFSRPASAWCERVRKRPLMMTTSLACAAAMGSIPLAASFGRLTLMQLWVAAFAVGSCHVVGMAASLSYIPHLVPSHRLMEANAKLASANTLADIGGPALAGALIGVIGAARAVAADAVSYLVTAWCTLSIRSPETVLDQHTAKRSLRSEIQAGRPRLHLAPSRHRPARDHECDHLHRPRPHQRHLGRVPNPRTPLVTAGVRRGHEHRRERRIPGLPHHAPSHLTLRSGPGHDHRAGPGARQPTPSPARRPRDRRATRHRLRPVRAALRRGHAWPDPAHRPPTGLRARHARPHAGNRPVDGFWVAPLRRPPRGLRRHHPGPAHHLSLGACLLELPPLRLALTSIRTLRLSAP
ncbi:MFS transporter [Streptomyces sp. NBC_01800]|uniref:MFS transporter n=1 Tax=Streptomyces sp. NBC_01800 TaxID=2975945 RepID=UPI003FA3BB4B